MPKMQPENPQDILLVFNPDVGCDDVSQETIIKYQNATNPNTGRPAQKAYKEIVEFKHDEYFCVWWDKNPFKVKPGETRRFPRYIAEHFAKKLADHLLFKEEDKTGKKGLLRSKTLRPKVINEILIGVESYFLEPQVLTPGEQATKQVEDLNDRAVDVGEVNKTMYGNLKDDKDDLTGIMKNVGSSTETAKDKVDKKKDEDVENEVETTPEVAPEPEKNTNTVEPDSKEDNKPKLTKKELIAECDKLDIEVTGKETVPELEKKMKAFFEPKVG